MEIRGQKKLKIIDRYVGIPLVFLAGLFKRKKIIPENINYIGVLLTPAIGDTILLSAPLKDLKQKINPKQLIIFVPKENKEAAELINIADQVVSLNLRYFLESVKIIRSYSIDLFIDFSQWARLNALFTYFSKSKFKIGFNTKNQHRKFIYDWTANHSDKVHEIDNFRNLISIVSPGADSLPALKIVATAEQKKITVHLKSGGYLSYLKEWPPDYWYKVIEYLLSRDYNIYFTGSKKDYDSIESLLERFADRTKLFNVAGKYSLYETAVLLKSSRLVISVDTAILHLTSAIGSDLVSLHGPASPKRWGPLNDNSISIQSKYSSAPCLNLGFEYNCRDRTGECMREIPVSEVIQAIDVFLNQRN